MAECNQFRNDIPQPYRIGIVLDLGHQAQDFLALRFSKHVHSPERRFLQIGQILKRVYRMNQYHEIRREKVLGSCYNHAVLHGASPEAQGPSSSHGWPLNFRRESMDEDIRDMPTITIIEMWDMKTGYLVKRKIGNGPWEEVPQDNQTPVVFFPTKE